MNTHKELLQHKLATHTAVIGVVGLGYVGVPLVIAGANAGFRILGFDINQERVERLNQGQSPLKHIADEVLCRFREEHCFEATGDFCRLAEVDAILICVPTPLGRHREPDLSFVCGTTQAISDHLQAGQLIVLVSTTYPGTTRDVVKPLLEASGLTSGTDFFIGYSPEREDPGNIDFRTSQIPKVVSGDGDDALLLTRTLYEQFVVSTIPVSSPETAEAVKLTENIFRAVNIALVNELKLVFTKMEIDIFEVIDAALTKPFGYMPFYPGPGLGGHCIPIDPFYLTWKAREHGISTRFIELAGEINASMPYYVIERLRTELDVRFGKGLSGSRIVVVGVAYKKNVADMRGSPALAIMEQLDRLGAKVDYYDPYFSIIPATREYVMFAGKASITFDDYVLARYDAALIVTDHDNVDYRTLLQFSKLVVDTRNVTSKFAEYVSIVAKA